MINRADKLAGDPEDWRWVVWARIPAHIAPVVAELRDTGNRPNLDIPDLAFSTSLGDTITDVILSTEPEPDNVRVFQAYAKGEAEGLA